MNQKQIKFVLKNSYTFNTLDFMGNWLNAGRANSDTWIMLQW